MAAKALVAGLIALAASGCALLERQAPVEVKVPVPVRAEPPPELLACTADLPVPRFEACGPSGWSCLAPRQEAVLRSLVHRLMSCDEAWRSWARPPD